MNVFWLWHQKIHGNVYCILLLDNCSAHDIDETKIPNKFINIIVYFIPNLTNKHQPASMGMIASLKVGYQIDMLGKLLQIFDANGRYEDAARQRVGVTPGCTGLTYGAHVHLIDAMNILLAIWEGDSKYARNDSILCCWQKVDILPVTWNANINNAVGSCTIPMKKKKNFQKKIAIKFVIYLIIFNLELITTMVIY